MQADAYLGYNIIYRLVTVIEVACWAQARSYFEEISKESTAAQEALATVAGLYVVEKKLEPVKGITVDEIAAQRQAFAKPILDAFKVWLDQILLSVSQAGSVAKALKYTLNNWQALNRHLEDGRRNIDNNPAERLTRNIAVGRKAICSSVVMLAANVLQLFTV
ncbi:MAG: transposase [Candidatus Azotimanducaceae bacterium]|jgi:transposase